MSSDAGTFPEHEVDGTLRWNDIEGGFWTLELEEPHAELGEHVVLQGWAAPAGTVDGTRVCARIREREEQFGFLMAGTMVDVVGLDERAG